MVARQTSNLEAVGSSPTRNATSIFFCTIKFKAVRSVHKHSIFFCLFLTWPFFTSLTWLFSFSSKAWGGWSPSPSRHTCNGRQPNSSRSAQQFFVTTYLLTTLPKSNEVLHVEKVEVYSWGRKRCSILLSRTDGVAALEKNVYRRNAISGHTPEQIPLPRGDKFLPEFRPCWGGELQGCPLQWRNQAQISNIQRGTRSPKGGAFLRRM